MPDHRHEVGAKSQAPTSHLDDPPVGVAPGSRIGLLLPGEPDGRIVEVERRMLDLGDDTFVDAVIGYRSWRVYAHDGRVHLWSLYTPGTKPWPYTGPKIRQCECTKEQHTCGIYAWKDRPGYPSCYGAFPVLEGEIALWGVVHVHEHGFRGDYAKPTGFYLTGDKKLDLLCSIAAIQYGVAVMR